ncbi:MAG: HEAT repeat domain-containing protein [Alphaproteobacteria bacterium]|nr:HEAT repeat domain-containing protein [Alphaproteobacteria bacterium]
MSHRVIDTEPIPFPEPGARPHYAPDRAVRIRHAFLRLTLEPVPRTFRGEARLTLEAYPAYAGSFELDLAEVEVQQVSDGDGHALTWDHVDGKLIVTAPVPPVQVVVRWHGRDPRCGLYFTGPTESEPHRGHSAWTQCQDEDGHFVFPCHDHPSVKHPWTIEIEAPPGLTLLSNGERTAGGERDGRAWARFEQREPMPAYLVTVVAAPLVMVGESWRGRPVRYLVPPGREGDVTRAFGRTPAMIEHLSTTLGVDYPWPRYDQVVVHDFVFGGMENVACTTMTDLLLIDEKGKLEWEPDMLVVHELAHQWFGDLVTCQDWSQGWLNESFATWVEALWTEHVHPGAEATWYRWGTAQAYHGEAAKRYQRPIVAYEFREPIDLFDRHLYNKGSCVLWMLRFQLGDEAFFGAVRTYLERHAHGTVHTRHLQRAFEEVSGKNLDRFFTQWIHSPGHPSVEVKLGRNGNESITVQVRQTQGNGAPEVFAFPLRLVVVHQDGRQHTVELQVDERDRTWVVPVQGAVATVRVDPGYRLLAALKLKGPDAWLERLLDDACPVLAVRAGKALLDLGTPAGRRAVARAMREHPFHGVRGALAQALGATASDEEVGTLIEALSEEREPRARRAIAQALGRYRTGPGAARAAEALIALLDEDLPTWQLEGAALVALGTTRDPRARLVLEGRLRKQSWGDHVRGKALEGLGEIEDPAVMPILFAHLGGKHADRTRAAAAQAVARLADVQPDLRREAVERLCDLAREGGFRSQLAAIAGLGRLRDPGAEATLRWLHGTAPDGRTRRMAFEALAQIGRGRTSEEGLSSLRRRLDELADENTRLRERLDRLEKQ